MKNTLTLLIAVLLTAGLAARQSAASDLYQEALRLQEVQGDLPAAIEVYKQILAKHGSDTSVVPKALLQLGDCYEKLGRAEARQMYERIIRQYPNSGAPAATARTKLQAMQAASGDPFLRRTLDNSFEVGSLDGRFVAYHKDNVYGRIYLREIATDRERVLVEVDGFASNMVFSPDGRHLAFDVQNESPRTRQTRIVTLDTGQSRTLPVRKGYPFAWLATDELFVYSPNYANSTVDMSFVNIVDGKARRTVPVALSEAGPPAIAPDGSTMVIVRAKRLLLVDLATGAERPLTVGSAEETQPVFSADSRLLAFASNADGKWAVYVAPIAEAPVSQPLRLGYFDPAGLSGNRGNRRDWWTADGTLTLALAYADSNIYRMGVDPSTGRATGAPLRLTQDAPRNWGPAVSPDSRHIAYWYRSGSKAGMAVMDAGGLNERRLADQGGNLPLAWRSADEVLGYDFATPAGQKPAIMAFPIKGGAPIKVAEVEGLYWHYVPARNEILHWSRGGGARRGLVLEARSIASGTDRIVAPIDYLVAIAASRDGTRIAYTVVAPEDTSSANPRCEIRIMTAEGSQKRILAPLARPCARPQSWSPDDRFLLVGTMEGPRIMNVESGESWPVHESTSQRTWEAGTWAPDGSFITLTHASTRAERLAWDGVTYDAVKEAMKERK